MRNRWVDDSIQDVRYAGRALRKNPGFTAIVVALLALAVGANTAIFSLVSAVLLRPLPFPQPDRLVLLWEDFSARGGPTRAEVSPSDYVAWKEQSRSFADMAAFVNTSYNLTGSGRPEKLATVMTTANLFEVLGMQPLLGRTLTSADDRPDAPPVVVMNDRVWRSHFGAEPSIVGRTIVLNGLARTVVGVIPSTFAFPSKDAVLWMPAHFTPQQLAQRGSYYIYVVARLRPDAALATARAEMTTVAARLGQANPRINGGMGVTVAELSEHLTRDARPAMLLLLGAVGVVLLIASANVANLLLVRGAGRRKELALRKVLGAGQRRLARQLVTENVMLATLGAAVGLLLAVSTFSYLTRLIPASLSADLVLDTRVLLFTIAVSAVVVILAGTGPIFTAARVSLSDAVKAAGDRGSTPAGRRLRRTLVVAELTLTVVMLVVAGLLLRSYANVVGVDAGFEPHNVLVAETVLPQAKDLALPQRQAFYDGVLERVRALPGVTSAAYVNYPPLVFKGGRVLLSHEGQPPLRPAEAGQYMALDRVASERYFSTLDIPVVAGREFAQSDSAAAPLVAIVNQTAARKHWPSGDPLGKRIKLGPPDSQGPWFTVIGVAKDVRQVQLDAPTEGEVYFASRQVALDAPFLWPQHLVVRTAANPLAVATSVRAAIWAVDGDEPVANMRPMTDIFDQELRVRNTQLTVVGAFAILAFVMAAVGLYGVLAYAVAQQLREIGIRMALGARRATVVGGVIVDALVLALAGIGLGLLAALGLTRWLTSWLFEVSPIDPATFGVTAIVLLAMALVASSVPAFRSAGVDPASVLRAD